MKKDIGLDFTIEELLDWFDGKIEVEISKESEKKILKSFDFLVSETKKNSVHYGVNTGFGVNSNIVVKSSELQTLQVNLIRSHACGVGKPVSKSISKMMLMLRAISLSKGISGVSIGLVQKILELIQKDVLPVVPEKGSVGASGDLAPLAHLALPLIGEGQVWFKNQIWETHEVFSKLGIKPIVLGAKEGLALINGTQFITSFAVFNIFSAMRFVDVSLEIASLSLEGMLGSSKAFDSRIHEARKQFGQIEIAKKMKALLGSSEIAMSHQNCSRVQDPYSFRCIPQVVGASLDAVKYVRAVVEREINSVTDNPLIFSETFEVISGGNFHGQPVAMAMDFLTIAIHEISSLSEQRIQRMMSPQFSELPVFLAKNPGLESGLMMLQVSASALLSENKTLCHPAVVDNIPTNIDKEDHVSMGPWAARKCKMAFENSIYILAMEWMSGATALDFRRPLKSSDFVESRYEILRKFSPSLNQDRSLSSDIEKASLKIKEEILWKE